MENLVAAENVPEATPSVVRRFSFGTIAIVVFFALLWLGLWRQLSGEWSVNDQYSYGWFVPFFAIILFWLRLEGRPGAVQLGAPSLELGDQRTASGPEGPTPRREIRGQRSESRGQAAIAIAFAIIALLLLFPIRVFEIANPDWRALSWLHAICVVTITLAFLWSAGGVSWLRHFAFPVAFTLIAVPWVSPLEEPIVQGLMRVVAAISSELVALFGIPAQLEGNLIRIPNGLVGVNEACSGVRSLQTSLMIGLLFGELKRLSIFRRVILVFAAAAIAFFGNCARAFFLVWIAATRNMATANSWHDFAGYGIVAAVFIGSLLAATLLGRRQKSEVGSRRPKGNNSKFEIRNSKFAAAALVWLVLVEFAAAGWYRAHESSLVASTRWDVKWPQTAPNFRDVPIDEQVRNILRFDHGQAAAWRLPALDSTDDGSSATRPLICTVYFFRWKAGKNSALLANLHRPDVCLPAVGWGQTADTGVKNYPVTPNLSLPFRHFEFRHGAGDQPTQQIAHAFYCLWEDRVPGSAATSQLPQLASAPSAWTRDERVRAVLEGRRHLGQQVMELIIQGRGLVDEKDVETRFAALVPSLIQVEDR